MNRMIDFLRERLRRKLQLRRSRSLRLVEIARQIEIAWGGMNALWTDLFRRTERIRRTDRIRRIDHLRRHWAAWLILGLSLLTGLTVFTGILPGIRPWVVLVFYVTCPGLAVVRLFRIRDSLTVMVLVVALSLALDASVAMLLLYAGAWSYGTGLLILLGISLLGAAFSIWQRSWIDRLASVEGWRRNWPAGRRERHAPRVEESLSEIINASYPEDPSEKRHILPMSGGPVQLPEPNETGQAAKPAGARGGARIFPAGSGPKPGGIKTRRRRNMNENHASRATEESQPRRGRSGRARGEDPL
jgi:hypothetical protein